MKYPNLSLSKVCINAISETNRHKKGALVADFSK